MAWSNEQQKVRVFPAKLCNNCVVNNKMIGESVSATEGLGAGYGRLVFMPRRPALERSALSRSNDALQSANESSASQPTTLTVGSWRGERPAAFLLRAFPQKFVARPWAGLTRVPRGDRVRRGDCFLSRGYSKEPTCMGPMRAWLASRGTRLPPTPHPLNTPRSAPILGCC